MSSSKDRPEKLCSLCIESDLDDALDPSHFKALPPYDSLDAAKWDAYIRPIRTFTMESVGACLSCSLCRLLRKAATRIPHTHGRVPTNGLPMPVSSSEPAPTDGEGYTLAAIPAHLAFKTAASGDSAGGDSSENTTSTGPSSVFLLVIKGSNTLHRLAYEAEVFQHRLGTKVARDVVDRAVQYAKGYGTIISEAAEKACPPNSSAQFRQIQPDRLDYEQIKTWIRCCQDSHPQCKGPGGYIPGMKVIHCETRTIVKAYPNLPYVALSYVWGKSALENYQYPALPSELLLVIEDAIVVCKRLGISYLWVDRYCIWQDDPVHKMGQIARMDEIYGNALFTIVAAAGSGSNFPLPGVGIERHLGHQISETIQGRTLVGDYGNRLQGQEIQKSKWNHRGWTFQELVLSTRVLFFTSHRVSFLCLGTEWLEQMNVPISHRDGLRKYTLQNNLYRWDGIDPLIQTYSKRQLSFDSDALNAMMGIFRAWTRNNPSCSHLMGMPVSLAVEDRTEKNIFHSLWEGLAWSLQFSHMNAAERRAGFPSWSPMSIRGVQANTRIFAIASSFNSPTERMFIENSIDKPLYGYAKIETKDGAVQPWSEYATANSFGSKVENVTAIHIEGWCFKVGPFVKVDNKGPAIVGIYVPGQGTTSAAHVRLHPDLGTSTPDDIFSQQFEAITPYSLNISTSAILVKRNSDGEAERVGMLHLKIFDLDEERATYATGMNCDICKAFGKAERAMIRIV